MRNSGFGGFELAANEKWVEGHVKITSRWQKNQKPSGDYLPEGNFPLFELERSLWRSGDSFPVDLGLHIAQHAQRAQECSHRPAARDHQKNA